MDQLRAGHPREDFQALAGAIRAAGGAGSFIIEVGCGSGWNFEVLSRLLDRAVSYTGIDYSLSMIEIGRRSYPQVPFVTGNAERLPLRSRVCDILVSGTVIMHLLGYREAIAESCRVTRRWCVFHTVPVMQRRATTVLRKHAYGQPTIEVIFNETELLDLLRQHRLTLRETFESIPYDLQSVLGEPTITRTYLCELDAS